MRPALPALAVLLSGGCLDFDAPVAPDQAEVRVFEVPKGASASGLAARLEAEGLVPAAWQWKVMLRLDGSGGCVKAGKHEVSGAMGMRALLEELCRSPLPDEVPFTVVEGWRIRDIDAALVAQGWIAPGAYAAVAESKGVPAPFPVPGPTFEGYLFPETYAVVPEQFTVEGFIARQLATFQERFVARHAEGFNGRSLHDVVVMASLLEREEPTPAQRPIVAGILWKRLDARWKLGVDATSRYVLDDWSDRRKFLAQLRDPDDVYNTRLRHGLPPTAIGNPGLVSLEAAMSPVESEFWYYLHDGNGVFRGGRDGAEHAENKRVYDVY